jgi:hypothetical protein
VGRCASITRKIAAGVTLVDGKGRSTKRPEHVEQQCLAAALRGRADAETRRNKKAINQVGVQHP